MINEDNYLTTPTNPEGFFNPPELEVLYALTQLDGSTRQSALNIKPFHYTSLEAANKWMENKIIQLNTCYAHCHPAFDTYGQQAHDKLFEIWSRMTGKSIEEYRYPATVSWHKPPVSNIHITEDPITNFIREYRPAGFCTRINVVTENWIHGARFIRDLAIEFSMQQTGSTGRGIDFFTFLSVTQEDWYYAQFSGKVGMWKALAQEIASDTHGVSFDPASISTPPSFHDIPTLVEGRGCDLRRLVVVDLSDEEFPINAVNWLINYFNAVANNTGSQSTVVFLTSEHIPFDGQVFTF